MKQILVIIGLLFAQPTLAERLQYTPVDQAAQDPSLVSFRTKLQAAVSARDTEAVIAVACPDIYLSHGGNGGPEELRHNLTLPAETLSEEYRAQADALREAYWVDLEKTLASPGYFDDEGEFWMPTQWGIRLPRGLEPFQTYFVTGSRVSLRDGPSRDSARIGPISHELLTIDTFGPEQEYQHVRLTDGTEGYMHRDYLWSMVGHRAAFYKSPERGWQLCTFVAGD